MLVRVFVVLADVSVWELEKKVIGPVSTGAEVGAADGVLVGLKVLNGAAVVETVDFTVGLADGLIDGDLVGAGEGNLVQDRRRICGNGAWLRGGFGCWTC